MNKDHISDLIDSLHSDFKKRMKDSFEIFEKEDQSLVTDIDHSFSKIVKQWCLKNKLNVSFYSEEDPENFSHPACILDPIDGTKELVAGIPEYCVSMALTKDEKINHQENFGLIYNPSTGFLLSSHSQRIINTNYVQKKEAHEKLLCFVSRTEFYNQSFRDLPTEKLEVIPKGSIALKLGFLANSICDVVISLKPKNVWDIAAGTILCEQNGISFYEQGKRITKLDKKKYLPPLVWVRKEKQEEIHSLLDC